jgi:hypothetical protein
MTPEQKQKRIAEIENRLKELEAPPEESGPGIGEMAMRGLNYTGGLGRALVAGALEPIVGKDLVSAKQALKGTVPSSAEIMEKAGIPNKSLSDVIPQMYSDTGEGLALEKGGFLDPTARGTVGFGLDIAADPATYLVPYLKGAQVLGTASKAAKAARLGEILLNPIGESVGAVGKGVTKAGGELYKSAFEKADRALATRYGKGSIADLLKARGFRGSMDKAVEAVKQINEEAGKGIAAAREAADLAGMLEKPGGFQRADELIQKFASSPDPEKQAIAAKMQETLDAYKNMQATSATGLAKEKQLLRGDFQGDNAFNQFRISQTPHKAELAKNIYAEVAKAEDLAVQKALSPEEYQKYLTAKKDYGVTSKFGLKEVGKAANLEANRTGVMPSALDMVMAGTAAASGNPVLTWGALAKKARDIGRLTGTKTRVGPMMEATGNVISSISDKIPPQVWLEMLRGKPEGEQP